LKDASRPTEREAQSALREAADILPPLKTVLKLQGTVE